MLRVRKFCAGPLSPPHTRHLAHALFYLVTSAILLAAIHSSAFADSDTPDAKHTALLPVVIAGPRLDPNRYCLLNEYEAALLDLLRSDPEQQRDEIYCNATLSQVARAHAQDMATRDYFDHTNPDGYGPNYLVTAAGYHLPEWYPVSSSSNNLESIGAHFATAAEVWDAWANSPGHRLHVLGIDPFFADHTEVGVGYYFDPSSEYGAYWVVITAPPEPD